MHIVTYEILDATPDEVMAAMLANGFKVKAS